MLKLQSHDNSQRQMHLHPALVATFLVAVATNDGEGPQLMDIAGWCCFVVQIYHDVEECSAKEIVESHLRPTHEIKEVKSAGSRKKKYSYINNTVTAPQHFIAKQPKTDYTCNVDRIPCRTSCKQSRYIHSSNGECTRRRCEGLVASGDK